MEHRAVGGAAAGEVVTLHAALVALALRLTDHVDRVARLEDVDLHFVTDVRIAAVRHFRERAERLEAALLEVTALRAGDAAVRDFLDQSDLHGVVAVLVGGLLLYHEARTGLNDRHRDERAVLGEYLGHSDLLANDSFDCHLSSPWNRTSRLVCWASLFAERLDLDVDARGKLEFHERVDGLRRRLEDVEQPLVRPHLELLARLLVDVRRAEDGVARHLRRQRDRSRHLGAGAFGRVDDLRRRLIEDAVVIRFESDADLFVHHGLVPSIKNRGPAGSRPLHNYSMTSVTVPAPTVRPPSRIAKRRPFSMAIGAIRLMTSEVLSPGMTISAPSGSAAVPVTSVVRK